MKHAGHEAQHYYALASAWEFKKAEHYTKFANLQHQKDQTEYTTLTEEDLMDYMHNAYNEELLTFAVTDLYLNQLEKEVGVYLHSSNSGHESMDGEVLLSSKETV